MFETEKGQKILSECLNDGKVIFEEGVANLEDRNALARVTRSVEKVAGVTVAQLSGERDNHFGKASSASARKQIVRAMYDRAAKKQR